MGHHIAADGRFKSDKYKDLAPDKIVLSFHDPHAQKALLEYANDVFLVDDGDEELAEDILTRLETIQGLPIGFLSRNRALHAAK